MSPSVIVTDPPSAPGSCAGAAAAGRRNPTGPPPSAGDTVAVNVTGWPTTDGFADDTNSVTVATAPGDVVVVVVDVEVGVVVDVDDDGAPVVVVVGVVVVVVVVEVVDVVVVVEVVGGGPKSKTTSKPGIRPCDANCWSIQPPRTSKVPLASLLAVTMSSSATVCPTMEFAQMQIAGPTPHVSGPDTTLTAVIPIEPPNPLRGWIPKPRPPGRTPGVAVTLTCIVEDPPEGIVAGVAVADPITSASTPIPGASPASTATTTTASSRRRIAGR